MGGRQVTQRVEFECAYILDSELNAHRYKVEASVEEISPTDNSMIIDFKLFKDVLVSIVPNKTFLYNINHSQDYTDIQVASVLDRCSVPILGLDFNISAENLCAWIAKQLQLKLKAVGVTKIFVSEVKLRETNDSFVRWSYN